MAKRKTAAQLDAEIADVLSAGIRHPKNRARARHIASLMGDLTGDEGWDAIDLEELHNWTDLSRPEREVTDELLAESLAPEHLVSGSEAGLRRITKARGESDD
jgi:hypothetical protein